MELHVQDPALNAPALEISSLQFRYLPQGELVVDVPALTLARGEQLLLTGGSGTGKSTLLSLIAGLMDPTAGRINLAGRNIHALKGAARDEYRGRHLGMIFQTFNLLHGFSALENVMVALMFSDVPRSVHRPRAEALLKHLGIERIDAPPHELSVGQQQRVAVARAVVTKPALVLADEPTASLDPENAVSAIELIQQVCRENGAALLCVSHDPTMKDRFARRESLRDLRSRATA